MRFAFPSLMTNMPFGLLGLPPGHFFARNGHSSPWWKKITGEIQRWLDRATVRTLYIQKASPWENGYVESFNGRLRDELLDRELFLGLAEARYVLDEWRLEYNHRRPHSGIHWQTPAAFAACCEPRRAAATLAGPPIGAAPLPPAQPTKNHDPILSQHLV